MLGKVGEKLKEVIPGQYSDEQLKDLLYEADIYARRARGYLTNISVAGEVSSLDEKTANKLIGKLKLQAEDARLTAVRYSRKNEGLQLSKEEERINRELSLEHGANWISKSKAAKTLKRMRENFLDYASSELGLYNVCGPKLAEYQEQHDKILENIDKSPTLKAKMLKVDTMLDEITNLERDVFSNPRVLVLMSKGERQRLIKKYKFGEEPSK